MEETRPQFGTVVQDDSKYAPSPSSGPQVVYAQQQANYAPQAQYSAQTGVQQPQVVYVQHVQPTLRQQTVVDVQLTGPPTGHWRDGICDWGSNLWPSCCCVWGTNGIGSAWIVSQLAQKTGYWNFYSIIRPFCILWLLAFLLRLFTHTDIWALIPFCFIWVIASLLRFHIARVYNITENGDCGEFLIALCCLPCSISQMARHVYGYTKVFDGDSDPDREDHYSHQGLNGDTLMRGPVHNV